MLTVRLFGEFLNLCDSWGEVDRQVCQGRERRWGVGVGVGVDQVVWVLGPWDWVSD